MRAVWLRQRSITIDVRQLMQNLMINHKYRGQHVIARLFFFGGSTMKTASTAREVPGGSAALPAGSLRGPFLGPQGDENREPPLNAPVAPQPAETVDTEDLGAQKAEPGCRKGSERA